MNENTPGSKVEQRLQELKYVSPRSPQQAARGRSKFLNEAVKYQQAVSPGRNVRQSGWIFQFRKENFAMNVLISLILAASLLLGSGATVAAAQDDLPNQSLYQLKLWTENAKLTMASDPQEQAALLMSMAQTRVQEMASMAEMGVTPPDQVRERLEQHLQQALMLAADMDEYALSQTLLQLQERLQTQDHIMEQLQANANTETEPLLTQTRLMLQTHLQLVEQALADPQGFQYMMNNQMQYGQDETISPEPNQQGEPGLNQNDQSGQAPEQSGNGTGAPGGQNPEAGSNGSGNGTPGGQNLENPQGGYRNGSGGK